MASPLCTPKKVAIDGSTRASSMYDPHHYFNFPQAIGR